MYNYKHHNHNLVDDIKVADSLQSWFQCLQVGFVCVGIHQRMFDCTAVVVTNYIWYLAVIGISCNLLSMLAMVYSTDKQEQIKVCAHKPVSHWYVP